MKYVDPDGRKVVIVGTDDFKEFVRTQVSEIMLSEYGKDLYSRIDAEGFTVTIQQGTDEGCTHSEMGEYFGSGDSTITFNPDSTLSGLDEAGRVNTTPDIRLFHEMAHADEVGMGRTEFQWSKSWDDPGARENENAATWKENRYRDDKEQPLRTHYDPKGRQPLDHYQDGKSRWSQKKTGETKSDSADKGMPPERDRKRVRANIAHEDDKKDKKNKN